MKLAKWHLNYINLYFYLKFIEKYSGRVTFI